MRTITEIRADIDAAKAKAARLETEMRAIHERAGDRELTAGENERWTRLETGRDNAIREAGALDDELRDAVAELAGTGANNERGDGAAPRAGGPEVMRRVNPWDGRDVRSLDPQEARDRALAALERSAKTQEMATPAADQVDKLLRSHLSAHTQCDGALIARRLLLTENEDYRSAFMRVTTDPSAVLTDAEARALRAYQEFRAMSEGSGGAGLYGVPVTIDPSIILTAQGNPTTILDIARVETITTNAWKGVSSTGISWSFDSEAAEVSDDSPALLQPEVPTYTARGFVPFSVELGMDYPNFTRELGSLLTEGYMDLVSLKTTLGSGSGEPTGIVTALDANTNVEVTPTTDGAFAAADLYKLWDALPIKYRNRGDRVAWMSSTDVQNEARNFGSTMGANFTVDLTNEAIPRLFGRRYFLNDHMADFTSSTGAANLLIVGDWSNFLVAQRAGMEVELVPHLFGANFRPTGQRGLFAWARIGSDSINDLGFRLLQNQ